MTRKEILEMYNVDEGGKIRSPGKFEREPLWVPYFWDLALEGEGEDDGEATIFDITHGEKVEFPELLGFSTVVLREDDVGFVYGYLEEAL